MRGLINSVRERILRSAENRAEAQGFAWHVKNFNWGCQYACDAICEIVNCDFDNTKFFRLVVMTYICWLDEHDNLENNEKNLLLFVEDFRKEVARRFNRKYNEL